MNAAEDAVLRCREIVRSFVLGHIDYAAFRERMAQAMGPLDPLDRALRELTEEGAREAEAYVEWLGGEFGEHEDRIPRCAGWEYGVSDQKYGWVDQDAYRARLREALSDVLRLSPNAPPLER